jgi:hypothetical protein
MKNAYEERLRQAFEDDICSYMELEGGVNAALDDLIEILDDWHCYYQGQADDIKKALLRLGVNRYD